MALNPQQAAFIKAYITEPNATQAAIVAGYSPKTAYSQGARLLKHPEIAAILQRPALVDATDVAVEAVDKWHAEQRRLAYQITPVDEFRWDHKQRALDALGKAEGHYASDTGSATAFAIQINLGPEPVEPQQALNSDDD